MANRPASVLGRLATSHVRGAGDAFASFMSVVAADSRPIREEGNKSEKIGEDGFFIRV